MAVLPPSALGVGITTPHQAGLLSHCRRPGSRGKERALSDRHAVKHCSLHRHCSFMKPAQKPREIHAKLTENSCETHSEFKQSSCKTHSKFTHNSGKNCTINHAKLTKSSAARITPAKLTHDSRNTIYAT